MREIDTFLYELLTNGYVYGEKKNEITELYFHILKITNNQNVR